MKSNVFLGLLALSGAIAFVLGALVLFDPAGPLYDVSVWVAIAIAGTIVLLMAGALSKVGQARRRPAEVGASSIVGMTGMTRFGGQVFANGELWQARAVDGSAQRVNRSRMFLVIRWPAVLATAWSQSQ